MANKYEIISHNTALAQFYETKQYEEMAKVIYATLAAANGTSVEEERLKILKPLPDVTVEQSHSHYYNNRKNKKRNGLYKKWQIELK